MKDTDKITINHALSSDVFVNAMPLDVGRLSETVLNELGGVFDKLEIARMVMQGKTLAEIQGNYPIAYRETICKACKFAESDMACKPVFFGYENPNSTCGGLPVCTGIASLKEGKMYFKTEKTTV